MSRARTPRLLVLADGEPVAGVLDAEVTASGDGTADRFVLRAASGAAPAMLAAWAEMTASVIDVQVALDGGSVSLITGQIDQITADPVFGTVSAEGRDLRSRLLQAQTQESFANQTSSDIAGLLAQRHGLAAAVTGTSEPVGRYYSDDHTQVTLGRQARVGTEWDLLLQLAEREGFDVFVAGTTLFFQPSNDDGDPQALLHTGWDEAGPPTVSALRLHRRMVLAGTVTATVNSWNSQTQTMITQSAASIGGGGPDISYLYSRPNLTADRALALAQTRLEAITRHELTLDATMPGDTVIFPRGQVLVTGTGSVFDTAYVVDEVVRRLSTEHGFVQTLRAHRPGSTGTGTL